MYDQKKNPQKTHFQVSVNQTSHVFIELTNVRLSVELLFTYLNIFVRAYILE